MTTSTSTCTRVKRPAETLLGWNRVRSFVTGAQRSCHTFVELHIVWKPMPHTLKKPSTSRTSQSSSHHSQSRSVRAVKRSESQEKSFLITVFFIHFVEMQHYASTQWSYKHIKLELSLVLLVGVGCLWQLNRCNKNIQFACFLFYIMVKMLFLSSLQTLFTGKCWHWVEIGRWVEAKL